MAGSGAPAAEAEAGAPKALSPKDLLSMCGNDPAKAEKLAGLAAMAGSGGGLAEPKSPQEYMSEAEKLREEGNAKFKEGALKEAIKAYEKAIAALSAVAPEADIFGTGGTPENVGEEELIARGKALRIPVRLNLALCCLRLEPPQSMKALQFCEEVLCEEPDNPKATYRKAKALLELGEVAEAEYEFVRACKLSPTDKTVREDLEKLRQRLKNDKEQEKKMLNGLFDKSPGFASSGREESDATEPSKGDDGPDSVKYIFLSKAADNQFFSQPEDPSVASMDLQARGRLEEAVWALEAAVLRTADDAAAHFGHWVSLGRLYMDMNIDCIALRCLNRAAGIRDVEAAAGQPPAEVRRVALLLRAVCLLNEAGEQALEQVSACLEQWLEVAGAPEATGDVEERLAAWRTGGGGGADSAVAQGLLHLLHGREAAIGAFAAAVAAPEDASPSSCFGADGRLAVRWNMLGAVLASRGRPADALAVYDEALALQPNYPRALTNRGLALQAGGELTAAAGSWTAAAGLLPTWACMVTFAMLAKAVEDNPAMAEAAEQRSLPRLRELLGEAAEVPQRTAGDRAEVLGRLKLLA